MKMFQAAKLLVSLLAISLLFPALQLSTAYFSGSRRDRAGRPDLLVRFAYRVRRPLHLADGEPLGLYNDGTPLTTKALPTPVRRREVWCRVPTFPSPAAILHRTPARTDSHLLAGGLPDGTEVKFVTTGTLPGGLVSWQQDHAKVYYIKNWSGRRFKLSSNSRWPDRPTGRPHTRQRHRMVCRSPDTCMSWCFAPPRPFRFTCDPDTDVCTTEQPHQLLDNAPFLRLLHRQSCRMG